MPMHDMHEAMRKGVMGEVPGGPGAVAPGAEALPEEAGAPLDPAALIDQAIAAAGALPEAPEELLGILSQLKALLAPPVADEAAPAEEPVGQV